MKCPNCGAEMKEGTLYCEHCGEDIHIVPDFEPEIEYNMEQTLHDIAREMTPEEDATDDQDAQQSMTELQDWDEEPLENTAKTSLSLEIHCADPGACGSSGGMYRFRNLLFPLSFR